jgi:hypothetical protein
MNPLSRQSVSKRGSAKKFRHHVGHTKGLNLAPPPLRGGYRL